MSLHDLRRRGGGPRPRSNGSANGPLRKITGYYEETHGLMYDVLECGHRMLQAQDLIGPRYPERRRCKKCKRDEARHPGAAS